MKYRFTSGVFLVLLLGILAACGGSSPATGAQDVQITEMDFKIASSITTFTPGTPYHFVVANNGQVTHEFMIMPSAVNMGSMSMNDMDKMALAYIDTIAPGQTRTLDYTFPASAAGSHPQFACQYPGHYEAGMKLDVTVT